MNRWALFVGGVAVSVAVTVFLWSIGLPGFFLFLAFPFFLLPFGSRRPRGRSTEATGQTAGAGRDGRFAGPVGDDRFSDGPGHTAGRQGVQRRCPACGRRSQDPDERHCKRDGAPMADESP